ncbi:MAG: C40 family peptidase [Clostridiales Family XIII bacterium]|jgi:cell wall-associated NlpC family hydrolase|nr:C40 family peptidase [Clostridiales Family XIII bacterium]
MNSKYIAIIKERLSIIKSELSKKAAIALAIAGNKIQRHDFKFNIQGIKIQGIKLDKKKKIGIAGIGGLGVVSVIVAVVLVSSQLIGVTYNGKIIGYVNDEAEYAALIDNAKEQLSKENSNAEIVFDEADFSTQTEFVANTDAAKIIDEKDLISTLSDSGKIKASAYAIAVADKNLVSVATKKDANKVIKEIKARFDDTENGITGEFLEEIGIENIETKLGKFKSVDSAVEYLLTGGAKEETYVLEEGDTPWAICEREGITQDELKALNPDFNFERFLIGDELKLTKIVPYVHYQTVAEVTANEEIPYNTIEEETDTLYKGEKKTKTEGVNGLREVTRQVTKVNGVVTESPELSSTPISDPTDAVVLVGTKAKVSSGNGGYSFNSSFSGGNGILSDAYALLGVPYRSGGKSPSTGFDCSGFVSYVYGINGINIPVSASGISAAGQYIPLSEARPGDVVCWGSPGSSGHVGIYVGGGQYIDAPVPGTVVSLRSSAYYAPSFAVRFF